MELLEKRVKSRFSHRQIYLYSPSSFGDFSQATKNVLTLPETDTTADPEHIKYMQDFNNAVNVCLVMIVSVGISLTHPSALLSTCLASGHLIHRQCMMTHHF